MGWEEGSIVKRALSKWKTSNNLSYCGETLSYSSSLRQQGQRKFIESFYTEENTQRETSKLINVRIGGEWFIEPRLGRVANGVPERMDRLTCLGNAVVPQQVYPILKAIADIEKHIRAS